MHLVATEPLEAILRIGARGVGLRVDQRGHGIGDPRIERDEIALHLLHARTSVACFVGDAVGLGARRRRRVR
ncbi:MAG: hypothetical protein ABI175_26920 [Polyangiales bacterium]